MSYCDKPCFFIKNFPMHFFMHAYVFLSGLEEVENRNSQLWNRTSQFPTTSQYHVLARIWPFYWTVRALSIFCCQLVLRYSQFDLIILPNRFVWKKWTIKSCLSLISDEQECIFWQKTAFSSQQCTSDIFLTVTLNWYTAGLEKNWFLEVVLVFKGFLRF